MSESFDAAVELAWVQFEERVLARLRAEPGDRFEIRVEGADPDDYLRSMCFASDGTTVDVEVIHDPELVDAVTDDLLAAYGWRPPDGRERPLWWSEVPVAEVEVLRPLVTATFRKVFGVVHPGFLDSEGAWLVEAEEPAETDLAAITGRPTSSEELVALIERALVPTYGTVVKRDDDGDFPIWTGVVPIWVRALTERPAIRLFSQVVCNVTNTRQAQIELGILNRRSVLAKFYLTGDLLMASYELPAVPFAGDLLQTAIDQLGEDLNDVAADLAARISGTLFWDSLEEPYDSDGGLT